MRLCILFPVSTLSASPHRVIESMGFGYGRKKHIRASASSSQLPSRTFLINSFRQHCCLSVYFIAKILFVEMLFLVYFLFSSSNFRFTRSLSTMLDIMPLHSCIYEAKINILKEELNGISQMSDEVRMLCTTMVAATLVRFALWNLVGSGLKFIFLLLLSFCVRRTSAAHGNENNMRRANFPSPRSHPQRYFLA